MRYGFDDYDDADEEGYQRADVDFRPPTKCNRCGSTAVRWRQQGGQWVMFSLTPGVEHNCRPMAGAEEFE